jgi:ABC-2 type transport system permease protein
MRATPRWSFGRVVSSEFTKLRTLRSTLVIAIVMVGISAGFAALLAATWGEIPAVASSEGAYASATGSSVSFAQLVIGVLAVLIVSNEYTTNMIQSTFAASPKRAPVLAAKLVVAVVTTVLLSLVSSLVSFALVSLIFGGRGVTASLLDTKVMGSLIGSALYLVTVALFSTAVASIVRNSAAGIAIMTGVFFVIPVVGELLAFGTVHPSDYFLGYAAQSVSSSLWQEGVPHVGLNVLLTMVWLIAPTVVALALIKKRDA